MQISLHGTLLGRPEMGKEAGNGKMHKAGIPAFANSYSQTCIISFPQCKKK
jgi:hypothetical protein